MERNIPDEYPPLVKILEEGVFLLAMEVLPADDFSSKQVMVLASYLTKLFVGAYAKGSKTCVTTLTLSFKCHIEHWTELGKVVFHKCLSGFAV